MNIPFLKHPAPLHGGILALLLAFALAARAPLAPAQPSANGNAPGATEILAWKDGRQAALLLMFDDNLDSQRRNAVPELEKRRLKGTFYINPDKMGFMTSPFWQKELPGLGQEYGVHTMTHKVTDPADAAWEISQCAAILRKVNPPTPASPLISYGRPGGDGAFMVSAQVEADLLAKNQVIDRGLKDLFIYLGQDVAALDKWLEGVVKKGDIGKILFHGVGGDYLSVKMEVFRPFLDHVAARQDKLWVAGAMPVHKYATERQTATVTVKSAGERRIELTLASQADPKLYDQPLTLCTRVPAGWTRCTVTQGSNKISCTATDGAVQYEALPGSQAITIEKQ